MEGLSKKLHDGQYDGGKNTDTADNRGAIIVSSLYRNDRGHSQYERGYISLCLCDLLACLWW